MSLLIKALDKAQEKKAKVKKPAQKGAAANSQDADVALSLTPKTAAPKTVKANQAATDMPEALQHSAAAKGRRAQQAATDQAAQRQMEMGSPVREQAANVFAAKRTDPSNRTAKWAVIIGLILLALMAATAYWYQTNINAPDIVIPPRPRLSQEMPAALPEINTADAVVEAVPPAQETAAQKIEPAAVASLASDNRQQMDSIMPPREVAPAVTETLSPSEQVVTSKVKPVRRQQASKDPVTSQYAAGKNTGVNVTRQKKSSGVNPVLMRAYEAYNAGNDAQASRDYKAVLERYGLNVDALLGLGAIAERQGRLADANGWYRKVLEVEPRNEVARAGLLSLQQGQTKPAEASISQIKSMLATAPEDANLHAALGDAYASKGQWPVAQQAYFEAHRFNPSAENAFNLAVSLDQMAKPKLALPYYEEALQKIDQSKAIDAKALKARIAAIQ